MTHQKTSNEMISTPPTEPPTAVPTVKPVMPGPFDGGGAPTGVRVSVGVVTVDEVEVGTDVVFGIVTVESVDMITSKADECVVRRSEEEVLF
jgi:hypothetical protein